MPDFGLEQLSGRLPIHHGLYVANAAGFAVGVGADDPGGIAVEQVFDLKSLLRHEPEHVTWIDIWRSGLPDGQRFVCGIEGSHGSEGFFAGLDDRRRGWGRLKLDPPIGFV